MSTELLIVSESPEFASTLGIALTCRGAWRVSLASDVEDLLQTRPAGMVLLDSEEADAGHVLSRQLHEFGADVAVHSISRSAGIEASLAILEPAAATLAELPLEPLGGDESDARFWRYVSEPEFLRHFTADSGPDAPVAVPDELQPDDAVAPQSETEAAPETCEDVHDGDGAAGQAVYDLASLMQATGAHLALLQRDGAEVARAGQADDALQASLGPPASEVVGNATPTQLQLVNAGDNDEPDLLFAVRKGPFQLSLLVPDEVSVRALRRACAGFLADLD